MKWRIKETQGKSSANDAISYEVDAPESLRQRVPEVGENFTVTVRLIENGEASPETVTQSYTCAFVGDGKSLKIGDAVVRLTRMPQSLKKGSVRLRAGVLDVVRDFVRTIERVRPVAPAQVSRAAGGGLLAAPMTGKVLKVAATAGHTVSEGECLVVIEAMKMENQILADCDGVVGRVHVSEGDSVKVGDPLLMIEPATPAT